MYITAENDTLKKTITTLWQEALNLYAKKKSLERLIKLIFSQSINSAFVLKCIYVNAFFSRQCSFQCL